MPLSLCVSILIDLLFFLSLVLFWFLGFLLDLLLFAHETRPLPEIVYILCACQQSPPATSRIISQTLVCLRHFSWSELSS